MIRTTSPRFRSIAGAQRKQSIVKLYQRLLARNCGYTQIVMCKRIITPFLIPLLSFSLNSCSQQVFVVPASPVGKYMDVGFEAWAAIELYPDSTFLFTDWTGRESSGTWRRRPSCIVLNSIIPNDTSYIAVAKQVSTSDVTTIRVSTTDDIILPFVCEALAYGQHFKVVADSIGIARFPVPKIDSLVVSFFSFSTLTYSCRSSFNDFTIKMCEKRRPTPDFFNEKCYFEVDGTLYRRSLKQRFAKQNQ